MGLLHNMAFSVLPGRVRVASSCPPPDSDCRQAAREQTWQMVDKPSQCSSARPGTGIRGAQKLPEEPIAALV